MGRPATARAMRSRTSDSSHTEIQPQTATDAIVTRRPLLIVRSRHPSDLPDYSLNYRWVGIAR